MHSLRACINVLLISSIRRDNAILRFVSSINFFYRRIYYCALHRKLHFLFSVTTDFFVPPNYFFSTRVHSFRRIMENKFRPERILTRAYGGIVGVPLVLKLLKSQIKFRAAWESEICVTLCVETKRQILKFVLAFVPT